MNKTETYQNILRTLTNWDEYLLRESGLPGPRGNLELAGVVADLGDEALFERYLAYSPEQAPANTPEEFLAFCGALGLGKLLAQGRRDMLPRLRALANDPRWRTREAVAIALQRLGDADMDALLEVVQPWAEGSPFEQRAAAAALCEPRLLREEGHALRTLQILDLITASIPDQVERKSEGFRALKKGLGYCWSVAVTACPAQGKPLMEKWLAFHDPDILWILRENLKKDRLKRMDGEWVEGIIRRLGA
jgi:hypothetical protein